MKIEDAKIGERIDAVNLAMRDLHVFYKERPGVFNEEFMASFLAFKNRWIDALSEYQSKRGNRELFATDEFPKLVIFEKNLTDFWRAEAYERAEIPPNVQHPLLRVVVQRIEDARQGGGGALLVLGLLYLLSRRRR